MKILHSPFFPALLNIVLFQQVVIFKVAFIHGIVFHSLFLSKKQAIKGAN